MAKIYYRRIVSGDITIEDVPGRYCEEVRALLQVGSSKSFYEKRS